MSVLVLVTFLSLIYNTQYSELLGAKICFGPQFIAVSVHVSAGSKAEEEQLRMYQQEAENKQARRKGETLLLL